MDREAQHRQRNHSHRRLRIPAQQSLSPHQLQTRRRYLHQPSPSVIKPSRPLWHLPGEELLTLIVLSAQQAQQSPVRQAQPPRRWGIPAFQMGG